MTGTLINAAAILLGGLIGLLVNNKLPERIIKIVFQGIGLVTLYFGISMALASSNFLLIIFSVVLGSVSGELLRLDRGINRFGDFIKLKLKSNNEKFSEGMVTAFVLYCMGSMTILGSFEEGMGEAPKLLMAKSLLDGVSAIALCSALGVGVIFSIIPLLIFQGGLTLFAASLHDVISQNVITEMSAVGGILLIGLGLSILEIKAIKVINMLPALIFAVIFAIYF